MNRRLLWKLCLIVAIGTVALFYLVNILATQAEEQMSYLSESHQQLLRSYANKAEQLYLAGDIEGLQEWMAHIQQTEKTWAAIVQSEPYTVAGGQLDEYFFRYYGVGRGIQWMLHPWLVDPMMEISFANRKTHFLIRLPEHMRPSLFRYLGLANISLQILLPLILLTLISVLLYRHIMSPLKKLELATRAFSKGDFNVRVGDLIGKRSDELTELALTFDTMADRISTLILNQRQLISDLSHELRTPIARLDIAVESLTQGNDVEAIARVERESRQIRKLVEDTLTLAWLENESPSLRQENLDLVDLIDVVVEDARFEFPDRVIRVNLPEHAPLEQSNHRALGQALENIVRNAMRFTPVGKTVRVELTFVPNGYQIDVLDQGPGVQKENLDNIFRPFFREDNARPNTTSSFGLGLALVKRQISAIGGAICAENRAEGGLLMRVTLPQNSGIS